MLNENLGWYINQNIDNVKRVLSFEISALPPLRTALQGLLGLLSTPDPYITSRQNRAKLEQIQTVSAVECRFMSLSWSSAFFVSLSSKKKNRKTHFRFSLARLESLLMSTDP